MNSTGFNMGSMPKSVTCYICGRGYGTKSISIHIPNCEKKWDIEQSQKPKNQRRPCPPPPKNFMQMIGKNNLTHKELEEMNIKAFEEYNEVALEKCHYCNRTFNSESFKVHQRICSADNPFKPLKDKQVRQAEQAQGRNVAPAKGVTGPKISSLQGMGKLTAKIQSLQMSSNYVYNPVSGTKQQVTDLQKIEEPTQQYSAINDQYEDEDGGECANLAPCGKCGRNFAVDRLSKHEKVCKVNSKPKKVKLFHKKQPNENKKPSEGKQKWKEQHEALVANMKYMRKVKQVEEQGGDVRSIKPPPSTNNGNDFKQCMYCDRKFNDTAFERHSKVCQNIVNKPKPLMRKDVNYGGTNARLGSGNVNVNLKAKY